VGDYGSVHKADITAGIVSWLISGQFRYWAALQIRHVALNGWDNTTLRLGYDKSVRLPRCEANVPQIDKEHRPLPVLAAQLPVRIPRPIAKRRPGCGFPDPGRLTSGSRVNLPRSSA
jgi:aminoglycoside phosphotransferase (APT) family kinase protein